MQNKARLLSHRPETNVDQAHGRSREVGPFTDTGSDDVWASEEVPLETTEA